MKLSVVIPAYNEEENIVQAVTDVRHRFPKSEIIVVNDASTDDTKKLLRNLRYKKLRVLTNKTNKGHGYSFIKGIRAAKGDYILYIDADRQIGLNNFIIDSQYDIISGYRVDRHDKPFRLFITRVLKYTNLIRHGFYIRDANCPFKIYKTYVVQSISLCFGDEPIIPVAGIEVLARRWGLKTAEIPTLHKEYPGQRAGFLQTINRRSIKFCWEAFKEIWRI